MPFKVIVPGLPTPPTDVGTGQSGSNPTTKTAQPQLEYTRFARNGLPPSAHLANQMMDATNSLAMNRGKVPFCTFNLLHDCVSSSASSVVRHRFAWHSGPLTHALMVWVVMYPPNDGLDQDGYATFTVYSDAAEATAATTTEEFHYGANPTGTTAGFGWNHIRVISKMIDGITPDTDYTAKITQENYGRICSVLVIELPSMTEHFDGYLNSNIAAGTLVIDNHRENIATLVRDIWRRGAAHVFNFDCNNHGSPVTNTSATAKNVLDTSITSVSTSSPGYTLDMTGKARESESGVPCVLKAFGKWVPISGSDPGGTVLLVDSAGNTVASIEDGWVGGADPVWVSTTVSLPSLEDKYDLMLQNSSSAGTGTFSLYSCSLYEHHS